MRINVDAEPAVSPPAKWMRQEFSRTTHAFLEIDLRTFLVMRPVCGIDRFLRSEMQEDEHAERCRACVRELAALP